MMAEWIRRAGFLLVSLMFAPAMAEAQSAWMDGRQSLGQARLFNNDLIGDGRDRWRTGGYWVSAVRGPEWQGALPNRMGQVMEYRFRGEAISPVNLSTPSATDRPYVGALSVGAHTHFALGATEVALGADIVALGEQTGVSRLQEAIHDVFGLRDINVDSREVEDGFYLHGTLEFGREFDLGGVRARPFVELQAGVETMARAGIDLTFGDYGLGGLRLRDVTTGQRISAVQSPEDAGYSFLLGGDWAYVESSRYLPDSMGVAPQDDRYRLRAGLNYAIAGGNIFYGLTYLSEEFEGQDGGQMLGSLTVAIRF